MVIRRTIPSTSRRSSGLESKVGQTRTGKGNALACGFAAATGDFIVMLDADGSNDPGEIPRFVDALKDGADFAKGSRFVPGRGNGAGSADISRIRRLGNYGLNKMVNYLCRTHYSDLCYGYNAFRRECLMVIGLEPGEVEAGRPGTLPWGDGFEVETLINVRIAKAGLQSPRYRASKGDAATAPAICGRSPTAFGSCGPSVPKASADRADPPRCR